MSNVPSGDQASGGADLAADQFGLYDGFEAYRTPSEEDYQRLLTDGLIVPDTNVFLNLYRYNEETRADLFSVLRSLGDHLWVPRQVMTEFWRNREAVLQDPRDTDKTVQELSNQRADVISTLRAWANRVGLPEDRKTELVNVLSTAFDSVTAGVSELAEEDASEFVRDTAKDPILQGLEPILAGHVGRGLRPQQLEIALTEAHRRGEAKIPPGYKDFGKGGDHAAGDYLVWEEILTEAERRGSDVLIVTGDVKEDWWRRERGEARGPRPELAQEMQGKANVQLFMLRPESLLLHARQALKVEVSEQSVHDIERVAEGENGGWTVDTLGQLLDGLAAEGAHAQADVIRAASTAGGFIDRETVYALAGYSADRSLKGFTRPVNRITRQFRDNGVVPTAAVDVLVTDYDPSVGPSGWASGFSVPRNIAPLLRELVNRNGRQVRSEDDPGIFARSLAAFRALGHIVNDDADRADDRGRPIWQCERCASQLFIPGGDAGWVSSTGRAMCPRSEIEAEAQSL